MNNQPLQPIRLNKFLAERLGVSRREADDLIASGKVLVNDKKAVLGARIDKNDKVCYNNMIVPFDTEFLYLAFNKPVGYVCSRRAQGDAPTIYELIPEEYQKLKTVGRLDKDSSGLILLTNDGDFAFSMTHPKFHKEKVYEVELDRPLEPLHQQMISDYGVMLDDGPSSFTVIHDNNIYTVVLSEGRNRQIRRTFAALGYRVTKLHRTQFGKYQLSGLKPSEYVIIKP
ncbi:rRNA pseudouridine synthase [Candidatus Saccharibacteria bacterium]|jgi:pseudouridine synthase|nr:rRNA pseudouridine synthase [Candidatus Saccharibacteria bacterium]